jgi:hypothetical protein
MTAPSARGPSTPAWPQNGVRDYADRVLTPIFRPAVEELPAAPR